MTLVPRTERMTMPRNLRKPNLKRTQDRAKELETVDKPFLQVDRLDDEGDKVEAEVEGGEVVEGSHQQRLDLVFKSCLTVTR